MEARWRRYMTTFDVLRRTWRVNVSGSSLSGDHRLLSLAGVDGGRGTFSGVRLSTVLASLSWLRWLLGAVVGA